MASKFSEILLNGLAPVLQSIAADQLADLFNKFAFNDKKAYEAFMVSLYPTIDVQLEKQTQKSKSKIDDAIVLGLKLAIEQSAAANGVSLPNLDND
jgi:catalase (peroxidase I)